MAKKGVRKRSIARATPVGTPEAEHQSPADINSVDPKAFGIVAIGASAGGLEAFTQLLQALPSDTGLAYVLVQHLDPKHVSLLNELLQRQTPLPVKEVLNGMRVEPNQVYVIPRNTNMTIERGVLTLSPRPNARVNMPIDTFLRSLAVDQKRRAIAVILSGSASDGSLGVMAIKEAGGITFAQDTESARFDSMPRNAAATGCIDLVLPPAQIAVELARLGRHPYVIPPETKEGKEIFPADPEDVLRILTLLRIQTGVDFLYYKQSTIKRRIFRRMALKRMESIERYLERLRSDPAEAQALYEDILINVTGFFRDPEVFEALKQDVLAPLVFGAGDDGPIRVWVPGCSTGEEVYSIAMALIEVQQQRSPAPLIQIFGTDISERALDRARTGTYGPNIAHDVSPERLRNFFSKVENGYQISKRIREMCIFARQNVAKDPPFSKLDLISCRNVMIYFGPVMQRAVVPIFHYALRPSGCLLLGCSETISAFQDLFSLTDKKNKIYVRRTADKRVQVDFALSEKSPNLPIPARRIDNWSDNDILQEADRLALAKYAPPGVVVDDGLTILQFRGHTGPFLEPASGAASLNLLRMAREGLASSLGNAVARARSGESTVRSEGLQVRHEGGMLTFNLEVVPYQRSRSRERLYLLSFEPAEDSKEPGLPHAPMKARRSGTVLERANVELRRELQVTKEHLHSIIEELETSNEELRSANEEIQSSNEEMQSTNEELETSKEELQSSNEELNTVNEELNTRNHQLGQVGNDQANLLSNVNIPIVMMGNDLRIRRFTPISEKILNLIPSDVGRPISDIKFNFDIPNLPDLLLDVSENLVPKTSEVRDWNNRRFSLRVRPYRTEENKIEGVVLVLVDLESGDSALDAQAPGNRYGAASQSGTSGARVEGSAHMPGSLRAFTQSLIAAQEDERRKLSRELHDDLNQKLALLEMESASLEKKSLPPAKMTEYLRSFRAKVSELSDDLRRIAYQLHPSVLDDLGLVVALESYCGDFLKREGIQVNFVQASVQQNIPADVALALYRVTQAALRNVAKHSQAKLAEVSLVGSERGIELKVTDGGIGFILAEARGHGRLGLTSIEERIRLLGGDVHINSRPGAGTELTIHIPLEKVNHVA